jgi:peroxiredoxin
MLALGEPLPEALWTHELLDGDSRPHALETLIREQPAIIVFLRHFGCTGCSQQVDFFVPHLPRLDALGVRTVLVGNGAPQFIGGFVARHKLDGYPLVLVTDPTLRVYQLAGFDRSLWRTLGPVALAHELAARARGYFSTQKEGDILQQGGVAVMDSAGIVRFAAASEYAAKPIDAALVVEAAVRVAAHAPHAAEVA